MKEIKKERYLLELKKDANRNKFKRNKTIREIIWKKHWQDVEIKKEMMKSRHEYERTNISMMLTGFLLLDYKQKLWPSESNSPLTQF